MSVYISLWYVNFLKTRVWCFHLCILINTGSALLDAQNIYLSMDGGI